MAFFSTRTDYALILLRALARAKGFASLRIIAKENRLPYRYTSLLAGELKAGGFLVSREGVKGGYALAKKARNIRVIDVIEHMDGPMAPTRCIRTPGSCPREANCPLKGHWSKVHRAIYGQLERHTLADISS